MSLRGRPKPQDRGCAGGGQSAKRKQCRSPRRCANAAQFPGRRQRSYPERPGPRARPAPAPQQGTRLCIGIWFTFSKRTALAKAESPGTSKPAALLRSQVGAYRGSEQDSALKGSGLHHGPLALPASRPRNLLRIRRGLQITRFLPY